MSNQKNTLRTSVLESIRIERERQVSDEGWTEEHDDQHVEGELADAAACYAATCEIYFGDMQPLWPWDDEWDKRKKHDRKRRLVIAGALIVAELERMERSLP